MNKLFSLIVQLFKFSIVGVICFIVDFAVLYVLKEFVQLHVLLAAGISFSVSVILNYILSIYFVFDVDRQKNKKRNFILFVVFSVIGLILTELLMKLGIDVLNVNYMLVKVGATVIVMVYNFVTRKLFIERANKKVK
jgi:putative flippase GtrA